MYSLNSSIQNAPHGILAVRHLDVRVRWNKIVYVRLEDTLCICIARVHGWPLYTSPPLFSAERACCLLCKASAALPPATSAFLSLSPVAQASKTKRYQLLKRRSSTSSIFFCEISAMYIHTTQLYSSLAVVYYLLSHRGKRSIDYRAQGNPYNTCPLNQGKRKVARCVKFPKARSARPWEDENSYYLYIHFQQFFVVCDGAEYLPWKSRTVTYVQFRSLCRPREQNALRPQAVEISWLLLLLPPWYW